MKITVNKKAQLIVYRPWFTVFTYSLNSGGTRGFSWRLVLVPMGTDPEAKIASWYFCWKVIRLIFLGKFGFKNGISSKDGMPIHVTEFSKPISDIVMLEFIFRLRFMSFRDGGEFCLSQNSPKPIDLISSSTWVHQLVCPFMFNRYKSPYTTLSGLLAGRVISLANNR